MRHYLKTFYQLSLLQSYISFDIEQTKERFVKNVIPDIVCKSSMVKLWIKYQQLEAAMAIILETASVYRQLQIYRQHIFALQCLFLFINCFLSEGLRKEYMCICLLWDHISFTKTHCLKFIFNDLSVVLYRKHGLYSRFRFCSGCFTCGGKLGGGFLAMNSGRL